MFSTNATKAWDDTTETLLQPIETLLQPTPFQNNELITTATNQAFVIPSEIPKQEENQCIYNRSRFIFHFCNQNNIPHKIRGPKKNPRT